MGTCNKFGISVPNIFKDFQEKYYIYYTLSCKLLEKGFQRVDKNSFNQRQNSCFGLPVGCSPALCFHIINAILNKNNVINNSRYYFDTLIQKTCVRIRKKTHDTNY